jgi:hypothetical protein
MDASHGDLRANVIRPAASPYLPGAILPLRRVRREVARIE